MILDRGEKCKVAASTNKVEDRKVEDNDCALRRRRDQEDQEEGHVLCESAINSSEDGSFGLGR